MSALPLLAELEIQWKKLNVSVFVHYKERKAGKRQVLRDSGGFGFEGEASHTWETGWNKLGLTNQHGRINAKGEACYIIAQCRTPLVHAT